MDNYLQYRGKCRELSEAALLNDPDLILCKGWYICPIWGKQEHWWCKDESGSIYDHTALQFPSKGLGEYIEFYGYLSCEYCGKDVHEDDVYNVDQHVYCSYECYGHDVGF